MVTLILTSGLYNGLSFENKTDSAVSNRPSQEDILDTFEKNDYESWSKLVASLGMVHNVVTKTDFQTYVDARQAARSGNYDKAIALSSSLEMELKSKLSELYV